jgi:DNA polymerase-3 subunit epsilon
MERWANKAIQMKLVRPIAVIDLETTGIFPLVDRIVEIGILKVTPFGKQMHFRQRVNPEEKIPKEASEIHRIRDEDVRHKPKFKAIARDVLNFIRGCVLVGFNLKSFDLPMLQAEFKRSEVEFSYATRHVIDVKDIYHFHETRTLCDAVKFYCNSNHKETHSALGRCMCNLACPTGTDRNVWPSCLNKRAF